jgi:acyl carrier protein
MKNQIKDIISKNVYASVDFEDQLEDHLIDEFTFNSIIQDIEEEFNVSVNFKRNIDFESFENVDEFINTVIKSI